MEVMAIMNTKQNLQGMTFGRLTVVKRADDYIAPSGQRHMEWLCKCECGNYKNIRGISLMSGRTKSCGCLNKELVSKRFKSYNRYDLSGEYRIGYTSNNKKFYFDKEDYDLIKNYCWCHNDKGYVMARDAATNKTVRFHKLLFPNNIIDHINHDTSDNRKSNLRIVTSSQNGMNRKILSNNSSGVTGVKWCKRDNVWEVNIGYKNQRKYIGRYKSFDEAVKARKNAEEKYYGQYSYDNSVQLSDLI